MVPTVADFLLIHTPCPFTVPTTHPFMVLMGDGSLERTVQRLSIFVLRVQRCTKTHKLEHLTGFQEALLVLAHQMLLHLDTGRHPPPVTLNQAEHIPETGNHKGFVFITAVSKPHTALAYHIVGIISMYVFTTLHATRKIHVIHRNLGQGELPTVAVHVWHLLVVEFRPPTTLFLYEYLVGRLVQDVANGTFAQFFRITVLIRKIVMVEYFPGFQIPYLQLTAHKGDIHFVYVTAIRLVRQHRDAQHETLGLVIHFPRALVTELSTDKALITVLLVLVHLLPETQGTRRQIMPELLAQRLNGSSHHAPIILLSH